MNVLTNRHKVIFAACFAFAAILFSLVMLPGPSATVNSQSNWGPINNQASLNGERLTYYPAPTVEKCQSDCNGNPNCKGFTLVRAGTYNANDPAMCYLMSSVTSVVAANCCISAVKNSGGGDTGWGPINNQAYLTGTNLTYYPESTAGRCQSVCNGNPKCKGFSFVRAGAYNPNDQSMCYILSEVTGSVPSNCCVSGVKSGGGSGTVSIAGRWNNGSYEISQNGSTFTWITPNGEKGEGFINGKSVSVKWTGGGSATGNVTQVDSSGRGTRIEWSNGVVFARN